METMRRSMIAGWMLGLCVVSQMSCGRVLGLDGSHGSHHKVALASIRGVGRIGARCMSLRGGGAASPRMVRLEGLFICMYACMHVCRCIHT